MLSAATSHTPLLHPLQERSLTGPSTPNTLLLHLLQESLTGPDGLSRVDLVLSCVDNYEARMTINQVGEDGWEGHTCITIIQVVAGAGWGCITLTTWGGRTNGGGNGTRSPP